MKKFLKTLLGKKDKPTAPPSGDAGIPPHLIQELVDKVEALLPLVEPSTQTKLQSLAVGVQNDKLEVAVRSLIEFANDVPAVSMLEQQAIMVSAQFHNIKEQEKGGFLDKQMVRQRKSATVKQLTGMLDQVKPYLKPK
ncbi:MAG: hypothetical protein KTR30_17395 [Saprospiraceae bacterium]|nr:hypothetical protein [Saprospiraceae bacterium]